MPSHWKGKFPTILSCLLAGILTSFAFAPYSFYFIAFIGPVILIHAWSSARPGNAFLYGYAFGLGLFGAGVNWIHISINLFGGVNIFGAIALTLLFVAVISFYPAMTGYLSRRLLAGSSTCVYLMIIVPSLWVLSEWIRSWLFTGFPWLNLGYSQIDSPLAAFAPITGVYGVSGLIVLTCAVVVSLYKTRTAWRFTGLLLVLLLWGSGWLLEKQDWTRLEERKLSVALIQGAIPQHLKWQPEMRQASLDLYQELSQSYLDRELIIWPETAIPMFYFPGSQIEDVLLNLTRRFHTRILTGIPFAEPETKRYFNSIVLFDDRITYYHKRHLVPFGEFLPFKSLLNNFLKFLDIPMSDFNAGTADRPLIETDGLKIGVSICYEDTFGEEIIESLPEAQLLVNISNDAWFGDSAAPHQHLQMARMRALENGRYLLRATNTGISAIIDEKGKVIDRSAQFVPAALPASVKLFQGSTPYSRCGNTPVITFLLLVLVVLACRNKMNHQHQEHTGNG